MVNHMNPALEFWGTAFDRENILARMLTSEIIKRPSPILMGSRPRILKWKLEKYLWWTTSNWWDGNRLQEGHQLPEELCSHYTDQWRRDERYVPMGWCIRRWHRQYWCTALKVGWWWGRCWRSCRTSTTGHPYGLQGWRQNLWQMGSGTIPWWWRH